jgi:hypothetical protein
VAALGRVVEIDEGARRRVDLFSVDGERCAAGDHGVDLLVPVLRLGVILDDLVAGFGGGVRVDAECGDAERSADRLPRERPEYRDALDIVEAQHLHVLQSRAQLAARSSFC